MASTHFSGPVVHGEELYTVIDSLTTSLTAKDNGHILVEPGGRTSPIYELPLVSEIEAGFRCKLLITGSVSGNPIIRLSGSDANLIYLSQATKELGTGNDGTYSQLGTSLEFTGASFSNGDLYDIFYTGSLYFIFGKTRNKLFSPG